MPDEISKKNFLKNEIEKIKKPESLESWKKSQVKIALDRLSDFLSSKKNPFL